MTKWAQRRPSLNFEIGVVKMGAAKQQREHGGNLGMERPRPRGTLLAAINKGEMGRHVMRTHRTRLERTIRNTLKDVGSESVCAVKHILITTKVKVASRPYVPLPIVGKRRGRSGKDGCHKHHTVLRETESMRMR